MRVLIIDNESTLINKLERLFQSHEVTTTLVNDLNFYNPNSFDLIVLSGGSTKSVLGNADFFKDEIDIIKNTNVPILGICLGCELIAYTFNSTLSKLDYRRHGRVNITIKSKDPILNNIKSLEGVASHQWCVKSVSLTLKEIATSIDGIEILKHRNKMIYGIQFHPELDSTISNSRRLIDNFLSMVINSK